MDALVFDFDGVVIDSEPVHLRCFQQILAGEGIALADRDYWEKYLGFDDHDCFAAAAAAAGRKLAEPRIAELTAAKSRLIRRAFAEDVQPLPGAVELIRSAADAGVPVAVCSGALRDEIALAARTVGVADCFGAVVAAEDVRRGKPDPEGYALALRRLGEATGTAVRAARSLAVEDSPAGIDAARAAGMNALAVTNSYPADRLARAGRVVACLADVTLADLEALAGS